MLNDPTTPATPLAGGADPINTPALAATNTTPEPQAGDGHETISLEEARKLRSEAANLRKRMKSYEDAEKQAAEAKKLADEAQLSEIERTKKQHADIQAQHNAVLLELQETKIQHAVERHAHELNFLHPEIAIRLLDRADLEFEESGAPKNAKQALEKLLKAMPELARTPAPATPPPSASSTPTAPARPSTPAIPAMNPGRTQIAQPGSTPPTGRPIRLSDIRRR